MLQKAPYKISRTNNWYERLGAKLGATSPSIGLQYKEAREKTKSEKVKVCGLRKT